ncbi:MAG: hypothetical protein IJX06_04565, partial [Clostridia bacterium]|nr:hypothetical protein [Clostridia bacterium]
RMVVLQDKLCLLVYSAFKGTAFYMFTSTRLRDIFVLLGFSNATNSKISFSVDVLLYPSHYFVY